MMQKWHWPEWSLLSAGIVLRSLKMTWPLHGDEAFTYLWWARLSFWHIATDYSSVNNHIFHNLLMHLAQCIFGYQKEWALRLPVFLCGIAAMYLTWELALAWTKSITAARWSLAFMAFSQYMVTYSSEGRGYMVEIVLALLMTRILWSDRDPEYKTVWIGTLGFLLMWTILSGMVFIVPFYVYLFIQKDHPVDALKALVITGLCTIFAYSSNYQNFDAFFHEKQTAQFPRIEEFTMQYKEMWDQIWHGMY